MQVCPNLCEFVQTCMSWRESTQYCVKNEDVLDVIVKTIVVLLVVVLILVVSFTLSSSSSL